MKKVKKMTFYKAPQSFILTGLIVLLSIFAVNFTSAMSTEQYQYNIPIDLQYICTLNNAIPSASTTFNVSIYNPNGSFLLNNVLATPQGQGSFNYTLTFPTVADCYKVKMFCTDGNYSFSDEGCYKTTANGREVQDVGQISSSILYIFFLIGFAFIGLGYLFLKNKSIWVNYTGIFIMLVGFTFFYYDLHLSNLYATTIAFNSGAGNTTTGAFKMFANFLKLTPYIVAGIIAFASIRVLRAGIKTKKSSDGWDNNNY